MSKEKIEREKYNTEMLARRDSQTIECLHSRIRTLLSLSLFTGQPDAEQLDCIQLLVLWFFSKAKLSFERPGRKTGWNLWTPYGRPSVQFADADAKMPRVRCVTFLILGEWDTNNRSVFIEFRGSSEMYPFRRSGDIKQNKPLDVCETMGCLLWNCSIS